MTCLCCVVQWRDTVDTGLLVNVSSFLDQACQRSEGASLGCMVDGLSPQHICTGQAALQSVRGKLIDSGHLAEALCASKIVDELARKRCRICKLVTPSAIIL